MSAAVLGHLVDGIATGHTALADAAVAETADIERDDDLQLALFALYASSYGSITAFRAELEWDPASSPRGA